LKRKGPKEKSEKNPASLLASRITVFDTSLDVIGSDHAVDRDPRLFAGRFIGRWPPGRYYTGAPGHWFNTTKTVLEVVRSTFDEEKRKYSYRCDLRRCSPWGKSWREKRLEMALIQISVPARENYRVIKGF
jgi:hypothetical protein